jgi:hypothetical protein
MARELLTAWPPGQGHRGSADFAKQSFEGLVAHTTKIGQLFSDLIKEAVKPMETAVAQGTAKAAK